MKKRLLLTGGTGFIGKNLIPVLENSEIEVHVIGRFTHNHSLNGIHYISCDLHDFDKVNGIIKNLEVTDLLHLAWSMEPSNYNLPNNFDWIRTSINLLDAFRKNGGKRAVFAGSCVEYNWEFGNCIEYNTPLSFQNLYGSAKNILQQYAFSYCNYYGIKLAWPRVFFLYGPHEHSERLLAHVISSILKNKKAKILNGDIYRDYMYVKDCANILYDILQSDYSGIINIGTGVPAKLGDIGKQAANIMGSSELLQIEYPIVANNKVVVADMRVFNREIGFTDFTPLEKGLVETIKWWQDNN